MSHTKEQPSVFTPPLEEIQDLNHRPRQTKRLAGGGFVVTPAFVAAATAAAATAAAVVVSAAADATALQGHFIQIQNEIVETKVDCVFSRCFPAPLTHRRAQEEPHLFRLGSAEDEKISGVLVLVVRQQRDKCVVMDDGLCERGGQKRAGEAARCHTAVHAYYPSVGDIQPVPH